MSDRTPTTDDVLSSYLYDCHQHRRGGLIAEFDRWLKQVQAEAWDEGSSTMRDIYGDTVETNPYRQEKDA